MISWDALSIRRDLVRGSVREPDLVAMAPSVEAKEIIGGYAIFELQNKEEAMALTVEFMQLHRDLMPGWEGTCEVRAFGTPPRTGSHG